MSLTGHADARFRALSQVAKRKPIKKERPKDENGRELKISDTYGAYTFDLKTMRSKLSKEVFQKLEQSMNSGEKIDLEVADAIALAVKEWAIDLGATHFCHWFQPLTGLTAEKHDAFLSIDENGDPIEKLSGAQLIQSEPDASSFPSGGMRTTFEARGYTAWDPSSPIFILESTNTKTLCIPSLFISYHGDALDEKTVLLRSTGAISKEASQLLQLLGEDSIERVMPTLGTEQEYFLIDSDYYRLRPDLVMAKRTLLGSSPPRGQQLEDHYFGSIPARVQAFMGELEFELYRLGVPLKTRHNEVAPSQFETAPIFEEANRAVDHNALTMDVLAKVARRHGFKCLLHEKPFAELNGNGKHCNWSLELLRSTSEGERTVNLLDPGNTPQRNLRFLLFLTAVLKGVHDHGGLLRAGIASAGNDHRLGGNEAPPAIISVFLGELLSRILDKIENEDKFDEEYEKLFIELGISQVPLVAKDNTDRNRTSPFAFTGNKFEFRAVGASMSPAIPTTFLNAAVADGIKQIRMTLEKKLKSSKSKEAAVLAVLRDAIKASKPIRFEGNNYSDEWKNEAKNRNLPNLINTPQALRELVSEKTKRLLDELKIFSSAEIESRFNVRLERYNKQVLIEALTLNEMVLNQVLPAAFAYRRDLLQSITDAKQLSYQAPEEEICKTMGSTVELLQGRQQKLAQFIKQAETVGDELALADFLAEKVLPEMEAVREQCDAIEQLVPDQLWPLPKYREMLFLS